MTKIFLFTAFIFSSFLSFAQSSLIALEKPTITPTIFGKFLSITNATISNGGTYVMYGLNDPVGNESGYYIKAVNDDWQSKRVGYGQFSNNSRYYIFKSGDSLVFLDLQKRTTETFSGVISFKQSGKFIAYLLKTENHLVIKNSETRKEIFFDDVREYYFDNAGNFLLIVSAAKKVIQLINLGNGNKTRIWTSDSDGAEPGSFIFSKTGNGLAYVVEAHGKKSIWYYKNGTDKALEIANDQQLPAKDLLIDGIDYRGFLSDDKFLLFTLKGQEKDKPKPQNGVDVWSYTDSKLQSEQLIDLRTKSFLASVNLDNRKIITIGEMDDKIQVADGYALVASLRGAGLYDDWYWNKKNASEVNLISVEDGSHRLLANNIPYTIADAYSISPSGKYVIHYDAELKCYFSYEISTGVTRNITDGIDANWTDYDKSDIAMGKYAPIDGAKPVTVKNDQAIFLYDQCDIYQIDPSGQRHAINLTAGYGRKNNIAFRFSIENEQQTFTNGEKMIVSAFSRSTKEDGFYSIIIGKSSEPRLLTKGPYIYNGTWEDERFNPVYPIKAKNADVFLVRRMSAQEFPNYFWTKDFKVFNKVSDYHPERKYNWITSELLNWQLPGGANEQGILYKPEDFDPSKRYPVIINYYERMTEALNMFISPDVSTGDLNIPYFVSNGYLVFTPDIHFQIGHPGQSVLQTIVSATEYLEKLPYVDEKHIGIQGHSRGGWETNYLITHTNKFAAAVSAAGFSDYVSLYNGVRLRYLGFSRQSTYENVYQRIGGTLWQNPELYIENSPIFNADKIASPVLMFANKEDKDVPFEQGVEFFTALRRLGKRAWMLQYDGEGHMVFDKAALDFTMRMKQFFDHYLKDSACPRWMLYDVPATEKGNPDALRLVYEKDPKTGKWLTPKEGGLLTEEEKKKVEALKHRKPVTITIE